MGDQVAQVQDARADLLDSLFAFSDFPIRALTWVGVAGLAISVVLALIVFLAKITGAIPVPGYAATVLTVIFFAALNSFGLGIIGAYTWRAYENTKGRPQAIVLRAKNYGPVESARPAEAAMTAGAEIDR